MDGPPLSHAALLIGDDGRIAACGPAAAVPTPADAESLAFSDAILLPGLVNTHTHLELTGFAATAPGLDFRRWILSIRRLKQERSAADFREAARLGIRECWAGGVTTLADTGDSGAVIEVLDELRGSGIVYHEVFGPHPGQLDESFAGLRRRVGELSVFARGRVHLGVSPHAPYTVSGPLYARVAEWARVERRQLAVHLAESAAESELVSRGTGPFAEAWQARGIPPLDHPDQHAATRPQPGTPRATPVRWLDSLGVLGPGTLCIHTIRLEPGDLEVLAERRVAVAHCPGSNAAHSHGAAPLAALRQAGIRVGLGTDSVASVARLDLLHEARAARTLGNLNALESLALATLEGARALGLEAELGSLTPGKWGDVIAVRSLSGDPRDPPAERALRASPEAVALTVLGGRVVHRSTPA